MDAQRLYFEVDPDRPIEESDLATGATVSATQHDAIFPVDGYRLACLTFNVTYVLPMDSAGQDTRSAAQSICREILKHLRQYQSDR